MASKVYTAKEMREVAAIISRLHIVDRTTCGEYSARIKDKLRSMLRQAADMMEHNESLLNKAGETVVGLMNKMSAQDEEIKKLRTLVKELADALGCMLCDYDCVIHGECPASITKEECELFKLRVLVTRAREEDKDGK